MKIVLHPTKETILVSITSEVILCNHHIKQIAQNIDDILFGAKKKIFWNYILLNFKGGHLTLTPKESILSLVHNKVILLKRVIKKMICKHTQKHFQVLRLTSTASAVSGVSGFSDDFQVISKVEWWSYHGN